MTGQQPCMIIGEFYAVVPSVSNQRFRANRFSSPTITLDWVPMQCYEKLHAALL